MIKLDVTTDRHGKAHTTKYACEISGDQNIVIVEMKCILKGFYSIDGGEMLSTAMGLMLEDLNDKRKS